MKLLTQLEEIIRDVESANKRRNSNLTENLLSWKNWQASDIFETYNISSSIVKAIIERAIKTDGASLEVDISKLEKAA
ncbi:hypothetical protein J3U31_02935 [Gilliamella sp. B3486]|uniref:hypothetical protein n=1 Tax=unclassified Gilliamella TaxID=2685620 RepID=UPI00226AB1CF|nr:MULTISPECIES: hypothetical protein [unclassified Gilliamella]MCX8596829.1 hypothetical protein [Gilliamella sp. B3493]MCX8598556.1 hypothetical protein [Gilliamella sp. B3486]MCX8704544.1 hypothetical protein [Gilliamella sp. B3127]